MSQAERAAALKALHDAEAALEAVEKVEASEEAAVATAPAGYTYQKADTPFSRSEDVSPSDADGLTDLSVKPKWLNLPGYLGPIAINGS